MVPLAIHDRDYLQELGEETKFSVFTSFNENLWFWDEVGVFLNGWDLSLLGDYTFKFAL